MHRKTILIDLDGVLNMYNGNFNPKDIPLIKPGAKEFLTKLSLEYEVKIFTTRNKLLASKWVYDNGIAEYISDITSEKQVAVLYIDDRCIKFNGSYEELENNINNFQVWYKN